MNQSITPASTDPVYRKVGLRLLPLLFGCYIFAYIDRVNVGFAKLAMHDLPWFSDAVFGIGAGIFFVGYFLFEVPGNVILHKTGARFWISRIMVSWGLVSILMATSHNSFTFYCFRLLLGIAEAGFFPGIILYLTYWYPREYRARVVALFMTAIAMAGVVGSPISGWILHSTHGWLGLESWQWLFILEGVPTVLLGLVVPFLLPDGPARALWLTREERIQVISRLDAEQQRKLDEGEHAFSFKDTFRSSRVWAYAFICFLNGLGLYGISFWLPQIVEDSISQDSMNVGWYSAAPWLLAAVGMVCVGRHSDRTGERRLHLTLCLATAAVAFALSAWPGIPGIVRLGMISIAISGILSASVCMWSVTTAILSGTAAAAGIAFINSVGNISGIVCPEIIRWLREHHGSGSSLLFLAGALGLGAGLAWMSVRADPAKKLPS